MTWLELFKMQFHLILTKNLVIPTATDEKTGIERSHKLSKVQQLVSGRTVTQNQVLWRYVQSYIRGATLPFP